MQQGLAYNEDQPPQHFKGVLDLRELIAFDAAARSAPLPAGMYENGILKLGGFSFALNSGETAQASPGRIAVRRLALTSSREWVDPGAVVELPDQPPSVTGANSWAQADILAAYEAGMVPRDLMGNYQNPITRENFCRLAVAYVEYHTDMTIAEYLESLGLEPREPFADCDAPEVLAAAALGIVQGTDIDNNLFSPARTLTRADGAVMLANTCKTLGVDIDASPLTAYVDQDEIRSWARAQINFVTEMGIMTGSNNAFMPTGDYQTQQAILTFYRIGQNVDFS
jgi:hypothetical protein